MNDKEFAELQLRMTIVPQQVRWPKPEYEGDVHDEAAIVTLAKGLGISIATLFGP